MNIKLYSHNFGVQAVKNKDFEKIDNLLKRIRFDLEEYSATDLRSIVMKELMKLGWSDKVKIDKSVNITITSMKNNTGLCFQTGNVGRFYSDILKLEALFQKDKAESAIYIVPTKKSSAMIGSNVVYFERVKKELKLFKHIITIPIALMGIE